MLAWAVHEKGSTAWTSTAAMPSHRLGMLLHLWHRLGRYLSHADQRTPPRSGRSRITGHGAREDGSGLSHRFPLVIEGDHVPNHLGGEFNACAELEKPAQIIGVAPGLADQPAGDVVEWTSR